MFKSRIDLDEKPVETIMSFKVIEVFENYLEATGEHYDEGSTNVPEGAYSSKPIEKHLIKSNEVSIVEDVILLFKRLLDIKLETAIYQENKKIVLLVVLCFYV